MRCPARPAHLRPHPRVPPCPLPPGTFSWSMLPRSLSRQLTMTVAALEQFLSESPRLSNKVSRRLMSCSGGRRLAII